jgi:hypothetical protein
MELRLELKSPDAEGSGSSPLPLWPQRSIVNRKHRKESSGREDTSAPDPAPPSVLRSDLTLGSTPPHPHSHGEDISAIDRLRKEAAGGQLSGLWEQLLAYTVTCLSDQRWELRRMGDQVLPLLTQAIHSIAPEARRHAHSTTECPCR